MTRRNTVRIISFSLALVLGLLSVALINVSKATHYKKQLELSYQHSLNELAESLDAVETGLTKSVYANSDKMLTEISKDLYADCGDAKSALSRLPVDQMNLGGTYLFISQASDYANYLSGRLAQGEVLTEEEHESLYIGALQGPNMEEARDIIKRMTKAFHGYRTKNLILYMLQAVARSMGIERIYGVTNEGYYAMNHMRANRKLKTSFSDFWLEAGGSKTADERFDSLPLIEPRKTIEEVPTRKRAVYRKRFALLDEIDGIIAERMALLLK